MGSSKEIFRFLLKGVILASLVLYASAHSNGAPASACNTLIPSHGVSAQTSPSPYEITFSPSSFTAGGSPITVTISKTSGATFKGFLLTTQYDESCINQNLKPGTFTPITKTKTACSGGAVTHSAVNTESSLSFQWTPPSSSQGHVRFRATFVRTETVFWVDVKSSDVLVDSDAGAGQSSCTGQTTHSHSQTGSIPKDPACGTTKGCYSVCSGTTDCSFLMTWAEGPTTDSVLITMMGKLDSQYNYIAFGLSNDDEMDDDSVHYCINEATGVYSCYNDGKSNVQLTDPKLGVSDTTVTFQNGVLTCNFTRTTAGGDNGRLFAFDKEYTLFWAQGPGSSGGAGEHAEIPKISMESVSLQDFTVDVSAKSDSPLVKAHGSLMVAAWIFCASVGIVLARFFKNVWEDKTWFGQKIWFQIHRGCMVTCLLFTVIAFIIIFVEVEGYSDIQGEGYKKAHPVIGIIVTVLTVINPIMALFRPHPGTKHRPIFNWLHWAVGIGGYTLAEIVPVLPAARKTGSRMITAFFGMEMDKAEAPDYTIYLLVGFVVWMVLVEILLEIIQCKRCNTVSEVKHSLQSQAAEEMAGEGGSDKYEMTDVSQGQPDTKSSVQGQTTFIKQVLLALHLVVITAFTLALIIVLNVGKHNHHDQDH